MSEGTVLVYCKPAGYKALSLAGLLDREFNSEMNATKKILGVLRLEDGTLGKNIKNDVIKRIKVHTFH